MNYVYLAVSSLSAFFSGVAFVVWVINKDNPTHALCAVIWVLLFVIWLYTTGMVESAFGRK